MEITDYSHSNLRPLKDGTNEDYWTLVHEFFKLHFVDINIANAK